ncbi:hypothetical protein D5R55_03275 [Burkholderia cenocepacia]|uniref:Uncharacterized protein n=1 Tax=Burkholderia cenocepacia TaxID=95486 RepID=A0A3S9N2W0_9BURK|nr:hypothetical protein D5R55_03275 [Burkholderia cenocepacia]
MPGATAQVGHVLIDIHRVTREASRVERHEFVGKRGTAIRGTAIREAAIRDDHPGGVTAAKPRRAGRRPGHRSIVSGLRSAR